MSRNGTSAHQRLHLTFVFYSPTIETSKGPGAVLNCGAPWPLEMGKGLDLEFADGR